MPNLQVDQVAENQANKEVTVNTATGQLDDALTEALDISVASGNVLVTDTQYRRNIAFNVAGATVAGRTVTLGNNPIQRVILVYSDSANTQNFNLVRGSTTIAVTPGTVNIVKTDGTPNGLMVTPAGAAGGGSTPPQQAPFRNRLVNGDFAVDQRNEAASTAVADDTYSFDNWIVLTETASVNIVQQTVQENGIPFNMRLTQNQAAAQRAGIIQFIEARDCKDLRGENVVLSPRVRISASQAIRYAILAWAGTEDTVTSDVVNNWASGTYTNGNFFIADANLIVVAVGVATPAANTWTTLAAVTGILGSTFNNLAVMIWSEGTMAQNVTLDFGWAQLEKGNAATTFEKISYEGNLLRCKRLFEKLKIATGPLAIAATENTTQCRLVAPYHEKRTVNPTVTVLNTYFLATPSGNVTATFLNVVRNNKQCAIKWDLSPAVAAGVAGVMFGSVAASAITIDASL